MRTLVTGVAGFIGSHVADALLSRGDTVVGVDNFNDYYDPARKRANLRKAVADQRFELHSVDVRDAQALESAVDAGGIDAVIHLAAMAGVRYSIERAPLYVDVNVRGTVHVLDLARKAGVNQVVFASTSSVYGRTGKVPFTEDDSIGRPLAPYPATKMAAELMGHAYNNMFGLPFSALRFFSVYGPRGRPDMMPYKITDCIVRDREFVLYEGGDMYRDWTYVHDVVAGILASVNRPAGFQRINLGRGEPVQMGQFVRVIEGLTGRNARYRSEPAPPSEPPITYADIAKARDLLGYEPLTSVTDGMGEFWAWYQAEQQS